MLHWMSEVYIATSVTVFILTIYFLMRVAIKENEGPRDTWFYMEELVSSSMMGFIMAIVWPSVIILSIPLLITRFIVNKIIKKEKIK